MRRRNGRRPFACRTIPAKSLVGQERGVALPVISRAGGEFGTRISLEVDRRCGLAEARVALAPRAGRENLPNQATGLQIVEEVSRRHRAEANCCSGNPANGRTTPRMLAGKPAVQPAARLAPPAGIVSPGRI